MGVFTAQTIYPHMQNDHGGYYDENLLAGEEIDYQAQIDALRIAGNRRDVAPQNGARQQPQNRAEPQYLVDVGFGIRARPIPQAEARPYNPFVPNPLQHPNLEDELLRRRLDELARQRRETEERRQENERTMAQRRAAAEEERRRHEEETGRRFMETLAETRLRKVQRQQEEAKRRQNTNDGWCIIM
jgi:hypothetical protein